MTGVGLIIVFVIAIGIMIIAISRWNIHPFLALMGISLLLTVILGLPIRKIPSIIGNGFSGTFNSIGIVIILGALIGAILEKTGGALKLAEIVVKIVGQKHPEIAMQIMGWVVSIPVFCDSGFVILDPIRRALIKKTSYSSVAMTMALSAGLYTSHVFIPPTPGPIAAANTLGIGSHLLLVIGIGIVVSIPTMIATWFFANYIGKRLTSSQDVDKISYEDLLKNFGNLPSGFLSFAPIIFPIICMALGSIIAMANYSGVGAEILLFLGTPIIALTVGLFFAIGLLISSKKINELRSITNDTLKIVGPILFITAAGGVLGKVISEAGFTQYMKANASVLSVIRIFFPFIISAILKTAQGSSTVALTTTAGIMGSITDPNSMMNLLGLHTPVAGVLTVMAIAAGAMTISHANDSYFWVVTSFGGLKTQDGYKTQSVMTGIMGVVGMLSVFVLSLFLI